MSNKSNSFPIGSNVTSGQSEVRKSGTRLNVFSYRNSIQLGLQALFVAILLITFSPGVLAQTQGLDAAIQMVARGTATPQQEMLVFFNNTEVNLAALRGDLSMDQYRSIQGRFNDLNQQFSRQAVEQAGFHADIGAPGFNPGTDTDVIVAGGQQRIRLEDIQQIETNYQRAARQHFQDQGATPGSRRLNTDTDFMPHPDYTDQFETIVRHINRRGGTAYSTPGAARAQIALQQNTHVQLNDAVEFSGEMRRLARLQSQRADSWIREANAIERISPERARLYRSRAQLAESQAAKYIERQHRLNNNLRGQHRLDPIELENIGFDRSLARLRADNLGRGPATRVDARVVRNMHQHGLQRASDNLVDTFAQIARINPSQANQASRAIASEIASMRPSRAGEAISRLERSAGSSFARNIADETRRIRAAQRSTTPPARPTRPSGVNVVRIMTTGVSAFFMGREGVYHALEQTEADDSVFDFFVRVYTNAAWYGTVGYAYEEAERAEIERFKRRLERGEDPSLQYSVSVTILKVPYLTARDTAIGLLYLPDTIYEAIMGGYDEITGMREAEAREQASIEFLEAVRRLVRDRELADAALAHAEEMGIYPEDRRRFLHCLCRSAGGLLPPYGRFCPGPECKVEYGPGGPCLTFHPLGRQNRPIPMDMERSLSCFNSVTAKNHREAQAIFDSWRDQVFAENYNSAEEDIELINELIDDGDFESAADVYDRIAPRISGHVVTVDTGGAVVNTHPGQQLQSRIANGLIGQAEATVADPNARNPTAQALSKVDRAREISPQLSLDTRERFERWDQGWEQFLGETLPAINDSIDAGHLQPAREALSQARARMGKSLPPRPDDPLVVSAWEKLADQEAKLQEAEAHWDRARQQQADGHLNDALESYRQGLALWPDEQISDRTDRLEAFLAARQQVTVAVEGAGTAGEVEQTALETHAGPSPSDASAPSSVDPQDLLTPPDRIDLETASGQLDADTQDRRHAIQVTRHGSLRVEAHAEESLRIRLVLYDADDRQLSASWGGSITPSRSVKQADLAPGTYYARVNRHSGQGIYQLTTQLTAPSLGNDAGPNDTREEVVKHGQPIPVNHHSTGLLGYVNRNERDTDDWYRFDTADYGQVTVVVNAEDSLGIRLVLRDADGRELHSSWGGSMTSSRSVQRADLAPGTYYARVNHHSGQGGYVITPQLDAVTYISDQEPNDSMEQAQTIPLGRETQGLLGYLNRDKRDTDDWFRFDTAEHGQLTVVVNAEDSLRIRLVLRDADGSELQSSWGGSMTSSRSVQRADLAPGTYYARVNRHSGQGGYVITPQLETVAYTSDQEPNDSQEQAQQISLGQETQGLLGYVDRNRRDTDDWFRFVTAQQGKVSVSVRAEDSLRIRLVLHDADGRQLRSSWGGSMTSSRSVEQSELPPGPYYIRVNRHSGQGGYSLRPTFTPGGQ